MVEKRIDVRVKLRRATALDWATENPVLLAAEPGFELDTSRIKVGDGVSHWLDLDYILNEDDVRDLIELLAGDAGEDPRVGDISLLTTEGTPTIVDAINQVNMPGVSLAALYRNAKAG